MIAPKAADQNITVVVLSDDDGTGCKPWGKFHNVADISCQRSLCVYRKYQAGRSFQLMHRSSVRAKCFKGRNKERLHQGWRKKVSTHW